MSPRRADSCTVVPWLGKVVTVKVALVAPAGTTTLDGTLAAPGWLLPSVTAVPPAGAAVASLTVPVALVPPGTLDGLTVNDDSVAAGGGVPAGVTVRFADFVTPPPVTEIVMTVVAETVLVEIWINPRVLPAGTTTLCARNGVIDGWLVVTCRN